MHQEPEHVTDGQAADGQRA